MFSQLSEQVKKSSQPVSDLFAANVKALQAVSNQQASFVSGVLNDSMKLMQTVAQQTEAKGLLAAQSIYAESVRERLTITSKSTLSALNLIGQQFADTMRTSFESAGVQAAMPIDTASAKTAVSKETAPAKKAASAKTAASKAPASAPSAKKAPVKKATAPAAVKSATKKATASKPVEANKVAVNKPATVNKTAKPVPKLSADNVRATPKTAATKNSDTTTSVKNAAKA